MGVWIEIRRLLNLLQMNNVAPFMGVWIEIYIYMLVSSCAKVAPFMGVWIEIEINICECVYPPGRSLYGSVD